MRNLNKYLHLNLESSGSSVQLFHGFLLYGAYKMMDQNFEDEFYLAMRIYSLDRFNIKSITKSNLSIFKLISQIQLMERALTEPK